MLYVTLKPLPNAPKMENPAPRTWGWHVRRGFDRVSRSDLSFTMDEVLEVQADGDELMEILNKAVNLPQRPASCRVQNWFGDDAKWIVANIITSRW